MSSRTRAKLFVGLLLLLANGYAALILYTYLLGTSTTARIDDCTSGRRTTTCYGSWQDASGEPERGSVADAGSSDRYVTVRLGPLGAYADNGWGMAVRLLFPAVADAGLLFGLSRVRKVSKVMHDDMRLMLAPGAALLLRTDAGTARTPDGAVYLAPGPRPGSVHTAAGATAFVIDRADNGHGEPGVGVFTPDGRKIGVVLRGHEGYHVVFRMFAQHGSAQHGEVLRASATGGALLLTQPDGRRVGGIAWVRGGEWLLRLEIPLAEPARTLAITLALEIHRLTALRPISRSTALGRGYAD